MDLKESFVKKFAKDKYTTWFSVLVLFHTAFYFVYRGLHHTYQTWDSAGHLALSMKFADLVQDFITGGSTSIMGIVTESNYYPPFVHIFTSFFNILFGYHTNLLLFLIFLSFLGTLFVLKKLVISLGYGEKTAFLTVFLYSFFPMVFDQYRLFHLEIPLILFLLLCCLYLLKSNFFRDKKYTLLFFVYFGVVQLIKWYGFLFLIVPVLYSLVEGYKKYGVKTMLRNILLGSMVFLAIVLPWYISNIKDFLLLSSVFSQGESDDPQKLLSLENIFFYIRNILTMQTYLVPFVLFWSGLVALYKEKKNISLLFIAQMLIVYLVFTFIKNKNGRYTLGLVPVFAFLGAYFLTQMKVKENLLYAVFGYSLYGFFVSSFFQLKLDDRMSNNFSLPLGAMYKGDVTYNIDKNLAYDSYKAPIKQVLEDIQSDAFIRGIRDVGVMPLIEAKSFSTASVELVRATNKYDKLFVPSPYFVVKPFKNDYEILKYLSNKNVSYLIVPAVMEEVALVNYKTLLQMNDFARTKDGIWTEYFKEYDTEFGKVYVYRMKSFNYGYKLNTCGEITNWDGTFGIALEPLSSVVLYTGSYRYQNYYGEYEPDTLRIVEINNLKLEPKEVIVTDLPTSGISYCYKKGTKMKLNDDIAEVFLSNGNSCGDDYCGFVSHVRINEEGFDEDYISRKEFMGSGVETLLKRSRVLPWYEREDKNINDLFVTGDGELR